MSPRRADGGAGAALCRLVLTLALVGGSSQQLTINVRNYGGEVVQERISANTSDESITLEFVRADGLHLRQTIDFTNEVSVLRVLAPGEEELGAGGALLAACFLLRPEPNHFIAPDAMAKLRQKNPWAVRVAEEELGVREASMDAQLGVAAARALSPHAARCATHAPAPAMVHARAQDLRYWARRRRGEAAAQLLAAAEAGEAGRAARCSAGLGGAECEWALLACVEWYPCGLKYCKGRAGGGAEGALSYRCGIRTCRRCTRLLHRAPRPAACPWDLAP